MLRLIRGSKIGEVHGAIFYTFTDIDFPLIAHLWKVIGALEFLPALEKETLLVRMWNASSTALSLHLRLVGPWWPPNEVVKLIREH